MSTMTMPQTHPGAHGTAGELKAAGAMAIAAIAGWVAWGAVAATVIIPTAATSTDCLVAVLGAAACATLTTAVTVAAGVRAIVRGADAPATLRSMTHRVLGLLVAIVAVSLVAMLHATHHTPDTTVSLIVAGVIAWAAVSIPVAIVIGRGIRLADTEGSAIATHPVPGAGAGACRVTTKDAS